MKSNQINFFTLPEELLKFEEILLKHDALFIKQPIYDLNDIYTNTTLYEKHESQFSKIYLTTKEFRKNIIIEKVEKQSYYLVNVLLSEVVEFSRGGFLHNNFNRLERGRLYYISSYFENNLQVEKSAEFIKWANTITSIIKREILTKRKTNSVSYLSKKVEDWMVVNNAIIHKSGLYIEKNSKGL
ncbi:MAG TPA: hypothetical protein PLC35_05675 [Methanosarcina vacuolata]|nr:hypothetical protein [Methanosarcina vacuolata]